MTTVYGIPNCDTVRKARRWLEQHHQDYRFHDFREDGLDAETVQRWFTELGWETVVNRRSTSWKQLSPAAREAMDAESALQAVLDAPTLIKRPVLESDSSLHLGFTPAAYQTIFAVGTDNE